MRLLIGVMAVVSSGCIAVWAGASPSESLESMRERIDGARARIGDQVARYRDPVGPRTWIDGTRLWYCETAEDGVRRWWLVDAAKEGAAAKTPLFDSAVAAEALANAGRPSDAGRLPVHGVSVERSGGGSIVRVVLDGLEQPLSFPLDGASRGGGAGASSEPEPVDALDGQKETEPPDPVLVAMQGATLPPMLRVEHDGPNLVVTREGAEVFRTSDGVDGDAYRAHWTAPRQDAVFALKVREGQRRDVHLVESAPRDQLQPKLKTIGYLKPGDAIDRAGPRLFLLARDGRGPAGASMREVALDDALFANPWSIDRVRMLPGGREVAFLYNERGHRVVRLVAVDLATGSARTIAEESYPTFVDYTNKIWMHWLDETGELLWMTERSGWNHLVLVDVATGGVKRAVTEGPWLVRRVHAVDERARTVDIALMGRDPSQDPYHVHHARVSIDAGRLTMLTGGDGTCRVDFSPSREALVSVRARADMPPVYEVRRSEDGAVVAELGRADDGAMRAAGWRPPKRFHAKGRDGVTDIWGLAYFPSDFDPSRPHPVIENIYAGPHGQHVPKWFEPGGRSREYAELGAVVVQIDGMGTNWRSKAFHDVAAKNLADAGFPDRIAWIRALAAVQPGLDLARVGIFGGSAGGQNAMRAVIDHAGFYRAAVADCGCHDNRMDKIWWNEQWMGWPVDESYARSSNTEDAAKLGGALMLVVGALDENVDPSSTMQVVQKLIDAGKDFELLVVPGGGHGIAESEYGNLRRARFLFRELAEQP
jgi:dipeptidyl aminopeptidase/acylaminoacyl peptidase